MHKPATSGGLARIGAFELDVAAQELRKSGRLVALTGQPMRVLIRLVESAGTIVTRDELQREIWGEDTHVDFNAGLSTCINQIRNALGDRAVAPRFVETLPRRGFRFVAPVEWSDTTTLPAAAATTGPPSDDPVSQLRPFPYSARASLIAVTAVVAVLSIWWIGARPGRSPVPIAVFAVDCETAGIDLRSMSRALTDTLIGALATEAGDRARVASRIAVQAFENRPLDAASEAGFEYVVLVTLLRPLGGPILVHVKLVDRGGWVRSTLDREMTIEELERAPLRLAEEFSKPLVRAMVSNRESN